MSWCDDVSAQKYQWNSATLTHAGKVRRVNEDACLEMPRKGLWAVADGMGGHSAGDVASQMVVNSLSQIAAHSNPSDMLDEVEDRLIEANRTLFEMCDDDGNAKTVGCTVAVLLGFNGFCLCLWAGDSRIYCLRDGVLKQISRDHSQVEELVARGEILREDADAHPLANVITRAVGGEDNINMDIEFFPLADGDRFLLCSDGLLKDVDSNGIAECLQIENCAESARTLVQRVLEGEADDNVSVAVVDFSFASSTSS